MLNNFDENFNNLVMSEEEIKSHKKTFSKLCFSFLAYLLIAELVSLGLAYLLANTAPELLKNYNFSLILSSIVQYGIAFPIFATLLIKIPNRMPLQKKSLGFRKFMKYALVACFAMYVGNMISTFLLTGIETLLGRAPENAVDNLLTNTNWILAFFIVGIIGPIFEELMFRKLAVGKLAPYGDAVAIFFPSLIFGLFHANLYQFFYAFLIGAALSYIYLRSGKIIYTIILHVFINVFFGVLPGALLSNFNYDQYMEIYTSGNIEAIMEYTMANLGVLTYFAFYSSISSGLMIGGAVIFGINARKIILNKGAIRFPKGSSADVIFYNVGTIILIAVLVLLTAINTLS